MPKDAPSSDNPRQGPLQPVAGDGVVVVVPIEKLYVIRTRSEATAETFWPRTAPQKPESAAAE